VSTVPKTNADNRRKETKEETQFSLHNERHICESLQPAICFSASPYKASIYHRKFILFALLFLLEFERTEESTFRADRKLLKKCCDKQIESHLIISSDSNQQLLTIVIKHPPPPPSSLIHT